MKNTNNLSRNLLINRSFLFIFIMSIACSSLFSKENIFWEAKADSAVVYMLGSVHFGSSDFYPLADVIENAFEKSDYMVTEIDMDFTESMGSIAKKLYLKKNDSLSNYLHDSTYKKAVKFFNSKGMGEEFTKKLTAMGVFFTISQLEAVTSGLSADEGIEYHFTNKAGNKKKLALETANSQLAIFDIFKGYEQDLVEYALASVNEQKGAVDSLIIYWKEGDTKSLEEMVMSEFDTDSTESEIMQKFSYSMLEGRNIKMTDKICEFLKTKGTYFVIVGAAHLLGEKGIVKLLEEKNISVKRL